MKCLPNLPHGSRSSKPRLRASCICPNVGIRQRARAARAAGGARAASRGAPVTGLRAAQAGMRGALVAMAFGAVHRANAPDSA